MPRTTAGNIRKESLNQQHRYQKIVIIIILDHLVFLTVTLRLESIRRSGGATQRLRIPFCVLEGL